MTQEISLPLRAGARVELYEDVDIDSQEGAMHGVTFSDYVEQHCAETNLLRFEESEIGMAEFQRLAQEADGVEIINDYDRDI